MVAGLDGCDLGADRLDDAGALVAQYDRPVERKPPDAVDDMQVAVANSGRRGAHQHLAPPRPVDLDPFDRQRGMHLAKYGSGSFHGPVLSDLSPIRIGVRAASGKTAFRAAAAAGGRKGRPGHTNRWTVLHTSLTCAWLKECDWLKEGGWLKEKENAAQPTLAARKSGMSAHLREDDANV